MGRVLALDGALQLSSRFEANYHEMMAHFPLNLVLGNADRSDEAAGTQEGGDNSSQGRGKTLGDSKGV